MSELDEIKRHIRTIPDWPKAGVMFRDITPLLQDPRLLRAMTRIFVERYAEAGISLVAGIDARGFIIGPLIAHQLGVGFVPVRKQGKLPFETVSATYELEYGTATVELHIDACKSGDRVLLVDDLIATGGTMLAAVKLLRQSVVEANTAFEKVQAASRQVLDLIDANVNNLAKKGEAAAKKK